MYWLVAGLLALGIVCGAIIRLPIFIIVLFGAAAIVALNTSTQGIGSAAVSVVLVLVTLQIGYVGGVVSRAAIRALRSRKRDTATSAAVRMTAEQKRQ